MGGVGRRSKEQVTVLLTAEPFGMFCWLCCGYSAKSFHLSICFYLSGPTRTRRAAWKERRGWETSQYSLIITIMHASVSKPHNHNQACIIQFPVWRSFSILTLQYTIINVPISVVKIFYRLADSSSTSSLVSYRLVGCTSTCTSNSGFLHAAGLLP